MNNFKKQFKQGDDYCDIRADYRSLISIGKSVEETEDLLLRAYCPKEGDLLFTPTFWLCPGRRRRRSTAFRYIRRRSSSV